MASHTSKAEDAPAIATTAWGRRLRIEPLVESQYSERRLGAGQDRIDELFAFSRSSAVATFRALKRHMPDRSSAGAWRALLRFVRRWAAGRPAALDGVSTIWLEFDDVARRGAAGAPSLSACLLSDYDPSGVLGVEDREEDLGRARAVLDAVGATAHAREAQDLKRCFAALSRRARFIHVSYMLGREPRAIKLYGTMRRAQLLPYLRAIGWQGDRREIGEVLAHYYPRVLAGDELYVDLDVTHLRSRREAYLGLAFGQQHVARGPARSPARERILEHWTAAGLCTRDKARLGRAWVRSAPAGMDTFLDLKIAWSAARGPTAKAYLGSRRRDSSW